MMAHKPIFDSADDRWIQVQAELLEMLLQEEAPNYPWEPPLAETAEVVETYFSEAEAELSWDKWSDDEIGQRANNFFSQLDSCFSNSLDRRFANIVPEHWLEAIVAKSKEIAAANLSLADRLVECVAELLPNWGAADLLVVARPLAYNMRDEEISIESLVPRVADTPWAELDEVEKARLSLAIARYVIDDLT